MARGFCDNNMAALATHTGVFTSAPTTTTAAIAQTIAIDLATKSDKTFKH